MSVRAAATVGQAHVRGDERGSRELWFQPGSVIPGKYHFPIGTAGATGLVLQTLYLPLTLGASAPSEVLVEGGTHVSTSPCFHFLDMTWQRYLELLGLQIKLKMLRPGFYPRGGGAVEAHFQPATRIQCLQLTERSEIRTITGISAVAGLPEEIAKRQASRPRNGCGTALRLHPRGNLAGRSGPCSH